MRAFFGLVGCLAVAALAAPAQDPSAAALAAAARDWLATLEPADRARASLPLESAARTTWTYLPGERAGLTLGEPDEERMQALAALVDSVLSARGQEKLAGIFDLEELLFERESKPGAPATHRDPRNYTVAIYGTPGEPYWSWRIEGHHLSLCFSVADGRIVSTTPKFLGSAPAHVTEGRFTGLRPLGREEDFGRALVTSLDEEQLEACIVDGEPPLDVLLVPAQSELPEPAGIPVARLDAPQREKLHALLAEIAADLRAELSERALAELTAADPSGVRFAWLGSLVAGEPHYFRVQGPTWIYEYENGHPGASHVHTVWRDLTRDFGGDPLARHLRDAHGGR
jgi:hypothetical protein